MADLETITSEEARARLLIAFGKAGDGSFVDTLRRPFLNPIEQRDDKGRRKAHTLLVVGLVLAVLAGIAALVFGLHLWGA
jgi:hypothetical protein